MADKSVLKTPPYAERLALQLRVEASQFSLRLYCVSWKHWLV